MFTVSHNPQICHPFLETHNKASQAGQLVSLSVAGFCNLVSGSQALRIRFAHHPEAFAAHLTRCLLSTNTDAETKVNLLTTFIFASLPSAHFSETPACPFITSPSGDLSSLYSQIRSQFAQVVGHARSIHSSSSSNQQLDPRLAVLSEIFLVDCCGLTI